MSPNSAGGADHEQDRSNRNHYRPRRWRAHRTRRTHRDRGRGTGCRRQPGRAAPPCTPRRWVTTTAVTARIPSPATTAATTRSPATTTGNHAEPGDDRGNHAEPGDDHGNHAEPGDDHGNHAEPGDDHGDDSSRGTSSTSSDQRLRFRRQRQRPRWPRWRRRRQRPRWPRLRRLTAPDPFATPHVGTAGSWNRRCRHPCAGGRWGGHDPPRQHPPRRDRCGRPVRGVRDLGRGAGPDPLPGAGGGADRDRHRRQRHPVHADRHRQEPGRHRRALRGAGRRDAARSTPRRSRRWSRRSSSR